MATNSISLNNIDLKRKCPETEIETPPSKKARDDKAEDERVSDVFQDYLEDFLQYSRKENSFNFSSTPINTLTSSASLDKSAAQKAKEMGIGYYYQGDYQNAIDELKKAKTLVDHYDEKFLSEIYVYWGCCNYELRQFNTAKLKFNEASRFDKNNMSIQLYKGYCDLNLKEYENAECSFKKSLEINPNDADAQYHLGCCYYFLKKSKESKEQFEKTKETYRHYVDAQYFLGRIAYEAINGNFSSDDSRVAIKHLEKVLECLNKEPSISSLLRMETECLLGVIYSCQEDYKNTVKYLEGVDSTRPRYAKSRSYLDRAYYLLGESEVMCGNCEGAIKWFEKVSHGFKAYSLVDKKLQDAYHNLGKIYFFSGDYAASYDCLFKVHAKVQALDSRRDELNYLLGEICCHLASYEYAIGYLDKVLPSSLRYGNAQLWLGHAYIELNRFEDAISCYRRAAKQGTAMEPSLQDKAERGIVICRVRIREYWSSFTI